MKQHSDKFLKYYCTSLIVVFMIPVFGIAQSSTNSSAGDYKSVIIGKQIWMQTNLNVDRFKNGDIINEAKTADEWIKATKNMQPVWCYFNNDPSNGRLYGRLYNWYAVADSRGLAPEGWHVASNTEWTELTDYLGGEYFTAGKKIKTKAGWEIDENGNNESKFNALPGGKRTTDGNFGMLKFFSAWWTSTRNSGNNAWYRSVNASETTVQKAVSHLSFGYYVRCIKN